MFIVGLTGGISSGKSAVSDLFAQHGITIVDADLVAREVVEPGTKALAAIIEHFGENILQTDNSLDRATLRQRIFDHPEEKQWLEELLHPLIREQMAADLTAADSPYAILSAPLLIEGGLYQRCDRVLVVDVSEQLQISRTIARDNNDEQQVKSIIASQISREQRLQKAHDIIDNSGSLEDLQQQVETLHQQYLDYAKQ